VCGGAGSFLVGEAKKQKADALVDLKIDVDEISGNGKSMFVVSAIATAVKLNKQVSQIDVTDLDTINQIITKHKILKSIKDEKFSPHTDWIELQIVNYELPEIFDAYLKWISSSSLKPQNWKDLFATYISNLNSEELFDNTIEYFSKENRTENENTSLEIIFKYIVIDYTKILQILEGKENIDQKRLCLNILYYYNKSYSKNDFLLVEKVLSKVIEVFPKTSTEEIGTGLLSKGSVYWRCQCGAKNDSQYNTPCEKCKMDEYENPVQTRKVNQVITKLEDLLLAHK
jgi:hypothetical protein